MRFAATLPLVFSLLITVAPAHAQSYQVEATTGTSMGLSAQITGTDNGSAVSCQPAEGFVASSQISPPTLAYAVAGSVVTLDGFSSTGTGSMISTAQCQLPGGDVAQITLTGGNISVGISATTWQLDPFSTAWVCALGPYGLYSQANPDGTFAAESESFDYGVSLGSNVIASGSVSRSIDTQFRLCGTQGVGDLYVPPFGLLPGVYSDATVNYTVGHFTEPIGPHNLDLTIQVTVVHHEVFDVPPPPTTTTSTTTTTTTPPPTTTTQPPSTGTTWQLTVKESETCCAGGRCEGDSAGFSSSLVLESDRTYRASDTCLKTGGALPDSVGQVRPLSRRRFALLTTNLDEIAEAFRECQGYDSVVLRAFRNRLKIAKDGLSLRGTLSYAVHYSQNGTVVACRVSGSYRGTLSK